MWSLYSLTSRTTVNDYNISLENFGQNQDFTKGEWQVYTHKHNLTCPVLLCIALNLASWYIHRSVGIFTRKILILTGNISKKTIVKNKMTVCVINQLVCNLPSMHINPSCEYSTGRNTSHMRLNTFVF